MRLHTCGTTAIHHPYKESPAKSLSGDSLYMKILNIYACKFILSKIKPSTNIHVRGLGDANLESGKFHTWSTLTTPPIRPQSLYV